MKNFVNLAIPIKEEQRRKIKIHIATQGITLKGYILGLVEQDLAQYAHPETTTDNGGN